MFFIYGYFEYSKLVQQKKNNTKTKKNTENTRLWDYLRRVYRYIPSKN